MPNDVLCQCHLHMTWYVTSKLARIIFMAGNPRWAQPPHLTPRVAAQRVKCCGRPSIVANAMSAGRTCNPTPALHFHLPNQFLSVHFVLHLKRVGWVQAVGRANENKIIHKLNAPNRLSWNSDLLFDLFRWAYDCVVRGLGLCIALVCSCIIYYSYGTPLPPTPFLTLTPL